MTVISMRELVKQAYPTSPTWPGKVNSMTDNQVIAIFYSLKRKGKIP